MFDFLQILSITAQLLFAALLLAIIGKPLLFLFRRYVRIFDALDFLQEFVINVYLGGLVLYVLALIPLRLFNPLTLSAVLAFSAVFLLIQLMIKLKYAKGLPRPSIKLMSNRSEQIVVLTFFLISLAIQVAPLSVLMFGSIHDTSLHALFAQLILEHNQIPATHQPYLPAAIIFPQGAHVIFAFAAQILGITTPLAVFYITALFNALTVLAAYHFGKVLGEGRYGGLSCAFIFTFVSMWPTHITWGGNTFILSIPLLLITATFLKQTLNSDIPKRCELPFYIIMGLFLGLLASFHPSAFLVLVIGWGMLSLIGKSANLLKNIAIPIAISIILISPFLFRFVSYYHLPGHNIGLPADIVTPEVSLIPITDPRITLEGIKSFILTMPFQYNISPYLLPRLITITLFILVPLSLIMLVLRKRRLLPTEVIGLVLCFASILLFLVEPINPVPIISQRAVVTLYISLMLLLGSFNVLLYRGLRNRVSTAKIKTVTPMIVTFIVLTSLYAPFIYYRLAEDPQRLTTVYRIFAVTTEDDYNLMLWMRDNLPQDSIILINPFEPGLFIPALSQRKAIYPFSQYHLSISYGKTVSLLATGTLSSEVFRYLSTMNVTHIYVGSKCTPLPLVVRGEAREYKWDPHLFLGNPNFRLVNKVGNAYLFEFRLADPQVVLADSFEYANLDQGGWQIEECGDGRGSVIITQDITFDGSRNLRLYAKSEGEYYRIGIWRRVYVPDPSNVTLSFHLEATTGFGPKDALMVVISDTRWDKRLHFTTNVGIPVGYAPTHLPSPEGYFEFNVSRLWEDLHNEQLPRSFYISILNYDADGIRNMAHVDAVAISV
jgi:hypothetical protein